MEIDDPVFCIVASHPGSFQVTEIDAETRGGVACFPITGKATLDQRASHFQKGCTSGFDGFFARFEVFAILFTKIVIIDLFQGSKGRCGPNSGVLFNDDRASLLQ